MTLRTTSRVAGALAVVVTMAASWLTWLAPSASGLEQERVTLVPDEKQVYEGFMLIGNNAGANIDASTTVTTDICSVQTSCDVVPLTVPDPGHEDDFFVRVTL